MKLKKGFRFKSNTSNVIIELVNRKSGNLHWNTKKLGSGKSHMIHEGTLLKHYTKVIE
jgi:hypothetical protein|tara:strand:+ start:1245 stop:1418 length:174 start_codon:yes stop_codon:yes gene_type:complete